jgi:hypothetical protein
MNRARLSSVAIMLAVASSAWAGVEPYPEAVQAEPVSTKTRADVIAELREAQRLGLIWSGEGDFPGAGVSHQSADSVALRGDASAVRARIPSETIEAATLGLLSFGHGDPPVATAEREQLIAAAGELAAEEARMALQAVLALPTDRPDAWTESR